MKVKSKLTVGWLLDYIGHLFYSHIRLFKFACVGASGVIVNLGLLYALVEFAGWHFMAAYAVAFVAAVSNNYLWNSLWTFRDKHSSVNGFGRYVGVSTLTLLLNETLLYVMTGLLGIWYMISALVGVGVAFLINFTLARRFVWKKTRGVQSNEMAEL